MDPMSTGNTKQSILPFLRDSTEQVEAAAVFALAELERSKGGGIINKQPKEKLFFLTKMGYPLWLYPRSDAALIFDGLNNSSYTIQYVETTSSQAFIKNLEANTGLLENYIACLSNYVSCFQNPLQKQFILRGLQP
jgi:hypothetical protein